MNGEVDVSYWRGRIERINHVKMNRLCSSPRGYGGKYDVMESNSRLMKEERGETWR